jgi:tetratricopeptide (TPR) repeat protein
MKKRLTAALLAATWVATTAFAQAPAAGPQVKSKPELDAIMAVQNAATPDQKLAAIDNVLTKFADTQFKPNLLIMAAVLYQQKGDQDKMQVYAERALEADPKSYQAMLMIAQALASRTREYDLDKEDKLAKVDKYAHEALTTMDTAEKPNPQLTDEQWAEAKNQLKSQAHEILGTAAMVRKKYDDAVTEYKAALDAEGANPEPVTMVRLAAAENQAGKPDDATALLDKVMAMPNLDARIRSVAQAEKARAAQIKNGAKPGGQPQTSSPAAGPQPAPTSPQPAPTTPQPEPTKP